MSEQNSEIHAVQTLFFGIIFGFLSLIPGFQDQETPLLLGRTHDRMLTRGEVGLWFKRGYHDYHPDAAAMEVLRKQHQDLRFVVFAGTWCSDTRQWLPGFYRVIDEAGIPRRRIALYFADRNKVTPEGLENQYHIQRLPTFILLKGDAELGRITETPSSGSVEKDILSILGL